MTTKTETAIYWISEPPITCELSGKRISDSFVDGRVPGQSTWGCFHPEVFQRIGGTLGQGSGQRYVRQPEGADDAGRWLKVEG